MFLTLADFLAHFPPMEMSKDEFAHKFTVMYVCPQSLHDIFSLVPTGKSGKTGKGKTIIKDPNTDKRYLNREAVTDYFYEIVIAGRHKYLSLFYGAYFEFRDPDELKWSGIPLGLTDGSISVQKNDPSRRLIRNLFYLELLDKTQVTNTVKSRVSFWQSLINMYVGLQLEDRFFAPSSIDLFLRAKGTQREARSGIREINHNNLFYLFQAYQPKASIFNPYAIKWILTEVIDRVLGYKGKSLFTPVLSWASYLVAFMHSSYCTYVGVDVMPSVCEKTEFLANWYRERANYRKKETRIICQPSETLLTDGRFVPQYSQTFDSVLVCPPYYDMEIYHEGPQSIELYPSYDEWLKMYWGKTVEMCLHVTKPGGVFALIANDYHTLDGDYYPLAADLDKTVRQYFQFQELHYLQNRTSPLRVNVKDRTERLFIYKKTTP